MTAFDMSSNFDGLLGRERGDFATNRRLIAAAREKRRERKAARKAAGRERREQRERRARLLAHEAMLEASYPALREGLNDARVLQDDIYAERVRSLVDEFLRLQGFAPWGGGAYIRDDEGGDTCYDETWALEHVGFEWTSREAGVLTDSRGYAPLP